MTSKGAARGGGGATDEVRINSLICCTNNINAIIHVQKRELKKKEKELKGCQLVICKQLMRSYANILPFYLSFQN